MLGKVIEGRYLGASVNKFPDKNGLYILTEDGTKVALSKKNIISIDDVTEQYPSYGIRVMMIIWDDFETSIFQIGNPVHDEPKANASIHSDTIPDSEKKHKKIEKKSNGIHFEIIGTVCLLTVIIVVLLGNRHKHTWQPATCTSVKVCLECGETEGDVLAHSWVDATCIKAKTCADCGKTTGTALGHTKVAATCTDTETCSVCGLVLGEALGHSEGEWIDDPNNPKEQIRLCTQCNIILETRKYQIASADGVSWSVGDIPDEIYNNSGFVIECNDFMGVYAKALTLMPDRNDHLTQLNFYYDSPDEIKVMRDKTTHSFVSLSFAGNDKLGDVPMKCVSLFIPTDKLVNNYTSYKSVLLNIFGALPVAIDSSLNSIEEGTNIIVELINTAADGDISKGMVKLEKNRAAVEKNGVTYTLFTKGTYMYITASIGAMETLPPTEEESFKALCATYSYNEIARNPEAYEGERAVFTGEVIQVVRDTSFGMTYYVMRVDVTKKGSYYTDTVYVTYWPPSDAPRILEDDIIVMYGTLKGEKTYTTVRGTSVTIPSFSAEYIDIK